MEQPKERVASLQSEFVRASNLLKDDRFTRYMDVYGSEDGIDRIVYWVVSQGKNFFFNIWQDPSKTPDYVDPNTTNFYDVAADVYIEKGGNEDDLEY